MKKGIVLGTLIGYIILVFVLVVILSLFFVGDGSLYGGVQKLIPQASDYVEYDYYDTPDGVSLAEQDVARGIFEDFFEGFDSLANDEADSCFYYLDVNLAAVSNYFIRVERVEINNQQSTAMYLVRNLEEANEEHPLDQSVASFVSFLDIEGVEPCLVYTGAKTQNFYFNWLREEKTESHELRDDYENTDKYILHNEKVFSEIFLDDREEEWETEGGAYVLYKSGQAICVIPTRDGGLSCAPGDTLDDDCFDGEASDSIYTRVQEHNYHVYNKDAQKCVPGG